MPQNRSSYTFTEYTRLCRSITKLDKLRIISLRYGSLSNFNVVHKTYYAISKSLKIPYTTVRNICLKFVHVGKSVKLLTTKR